MATMYLDGQTIAPNLTEVGESSSTFVPVLQGTQPVLNVQSTGTSGTTHQPLQYIAPRESGDYQLVNPDSEFVKGVKSGVDLLQQAGYGVAGIAGKVVNALTPVPSYRNNGNVVGNKLLDFSMAGIERQQDDLAWQAAATNSVTDIKSVGDFMNWAAWNAGQQIPMVASTVLTGGVAGAGAKAATVGSNALVKSSLNNYIKKNIGKEVFEKASEETKEKVIQSFVNQQAYKVGRNVGALQAIATESGLNWAEVAQTLGDPNQADAATAVFWGTIAGSLEMLGIEGNLLRSVLGRPVSVAADQAFKKGAREFVKKRVIGGVNGFLKEGTTEGIQELTNILNNITQIHGESFDSEDAEQLLNAFAAGGLIGAPVGALTTPTDVLRDKAPEEQLALPEGRSNVALDSNGEQIALPQGQQELLALPPAKQLALPSAENKPNWGWGRPTVEPTPEEQKALPVGRGLLELPQSTEANMATGSPIANPASPFVEHVPMHDGSVIAGPEGTWQTISPEQAFTYQQALPQQATATTHDGSIMPMGSNINPAVAPFERQLMELQETSTRQNQEVADTLARLKADRANLVAQQTQAKDVDPQAYEATTAQIKQTELAMTTALAQQAKQKEAQKEQAKKITEARDKVLAGLEKDVAANSLRNAKVVAQPRLGSSRVQNALATSKRELYSFREKAAKDLRERIAKLEQIAESSRRTKGYNKTLESLLKQIEDSRKKLNNLYKESDTLIRIIDTIDNDAALDSLADSIDKFFSDYKSTRLGMQPSAAVTRQQIEVEASELEIQNLEEQQKKLREQQKLIDQDPTMSELGKTLSRTRVNRLIQDLENQKGVGFSDNMNMLGNELETEAIRKQHVEEIKADKLGTAQDIELMQEAQAVNEDIATSAQDNVERIIEEADTAVKDVEPITESHPVAEAINATTELDNIEVNEQIEEFISQDYPADYETQLAHIDMQEVVADAQLSDVVDDAGTVTKSPARQQIDELYADVNDDGQAALEQYSKEVAEATAAERSLRTSADLFKIKNKALYNKIREVDKNLFFITSINRDILKLVTFVNSATDVNIPVEVQNIVSINNNILSAYHNGRIYVFISPLSNISKQTAIPEADLITSEIIKTVSKTLGIDYLFSYDATKRIQDKISKDPDNIRQHILDEFKNHSAKFASINKNEVLSNAAQNQIVDNLLSQQSNSTVSQAQSYYSTVNNTPLVTNTVPPMWGLLFGTTAQANTYEVKQAEMTDSVMESTTPVNKTNTIKFSKSLSNQSDFIKDIFMNKWRPIVTVNGEDNFVTIYANSSDTKGIQVRIDPKTKLAFKNTEAALDAVANDTALLSVPMMDLMKLYLRNFASPKKLSQALRALGIRAAQYDGRITLFAGDDTNLVPYFPDQPLPSMITKEDMVLEEIITESSIMSDNIEDVTDAEQQALRDYFDESVNQSRVKLTEQEQQFADGVNEVLEMYPVLRENTILVKDINDARIPADIRQAHQKSNDVSPAFFVETTGKIFLVLDKVPLTDDATANKALGTKYMVHEGIVHYGFTQLFNDAQKKNFLNMVNEEINKSKADTKGIVTGIQAEFDRFKKENPAYFKPRKKKSWETNKDVELKRIEEFIAWIAEQQSDTLDGKANPTSLTSFLLKILNKIKAFLGMKPTVVTIGDIYDSIKASAYKLKQIEPDSFVTAPLNTRGSVNVVKSVPVESNYLQGAKFTDLASAIAYTLDVANSHRYAYGIPPVDAEYMFDNNQIIDVDANINAYPKIAQLAQQANMQGVTTVRQFLDTMTQAHGADMLRAADVKIVKNANDYISLFSDNTITYANENGSAAVSTMNTIKEFLQLEDVTVEDADALLAKLSSEDSGVLNGQIRANAQRILKSIKDGDTSNLTTMDKLITNTVMSKLATDNEVTFSNPVDEAIIENNSFVQRAIYNVYKARNAAKKEFKKSTNKDFLNLDRIAQRGKNLFLDQWNALKEVQDFYAKVYGDEFKKKKYEYKGIHNTYNELSTMSNRVSDRRQMYHEKYIKKINDDLSKVKLPKSFGTFKTQEDYVDAVIETAELYAHAAHAKERNAALRAEQIAAIEKRNPRNKEKLIAEAKLGSPSGMSDAVADSILADYSGPEWKDLRTAVSRVQNMNRQVLDDYYNAGMIKKKDYDAVLAAYKNYVPLIADEVLSAISPDTAFLKSSATVSTNKKRIINRATGLPEDVELSSIIAQSIRKAQDTPLVIARNEVGRNLLDMVNNVVATETRLGTDASIASKNTLWEVSPTKGHGVGTKFSVSKDGLTFTRKKHKYEGVHDVALITVIDKDGNEQIIAIKDAELGKSLTASNIAIPNTFIRYLSYVTRQMSRLMTSRSPSFIIANPLRDIQQAIIHSSSALRDTEFQEMFGSSMDEKRTVIDRIRKDMFKEFKNLKSKKFIFDYYKATNQRLSGMDVDSLKKFETKYAKEETAEMLADFQDFIHHGGKTSITAMLDLEATYKDIRNSVRRAKTNEGKRSALDLALGYLDVSADVSETMVRFATYKAFYDNAKNHIETLNIPKEDKANLYLEAKKLSARLALDSTVNFSKRGAAAGSMNALWAFSSVALQSAQRSLNHLWRKDDTVGANSMRVGRYVGGYMMAAAFIGELCVQMMGDDEDGIPHYFKIPEHVRNNNIIIPALFGDGGYIKIPLPFFMNSFWAVGANLHAMKHGRMSIGGAATSSLKMLYSTGLPWNLPEEGVGSLVPTFFRPIYQIQANKTFAGTPIFPESTFLDTPDHQKYWSSTKPFWIKMAEFANTATFGDKYNSGLIDISPETIEHIALSYTGGLGRMVSDTINLSYAAMNGSATVPNPRLPVLSGVTGNIGTSGTSSLYYTLADKINKADKIIKDVMENPEATASDRAAIKRDNLAYSSMKSKYDNIDKKIKKLREGREATTDMKKINKYNEQIVSMQKQLLKLANKQGLVTLPE